jgi:hypothetical protein
MRPPLRCRVFGHRLPAPPFKGDRWGCARCGRLFSWEAFKLDGALVPPIDGVLWDAMEEVDAITPETPPIAPPRPTKPRPTKPPAHRFLGAFVDGAYVVRVEPFWEDLILSDGRKVTVEWFQDRQTSAPRV